MSKEEEVLIVSAARTPVGSLNGALSSLAGHQLGATAIAEALRRAGVAPGNVSEVIMGQVLTAGAGMNPARQAAMAAGLPKEVPAAIVNMLCGSGLRAVVMAMQAIQCGDSEVVVAGGQESMSRAPHCVHIRGGVKYGSTFLQDTVEVDGLHCPFADCKMGVTAENVAKRWELSREEQDRFAAASQRKAAQAITSGAFREELVAVTVQDRKGPVVVAEDEHPRPNTTAEGLAKLRPAFDKACGSVTAGNASGINDGAAAVVMASRSAAERLGLSAPLARVVSWAQAGVDPAIMGTGPIPAVRKAVEKAGWALEDVDVFELNEAFAAQSLAVIKELGVPESKVNPHGGAIALGHPIGASGCRVLVTLLYALQRAGKRRGVAALCVGGGMGIALCVERP